MKIWIEHTLDVIGDGNRIFRSMWQLVGNEFHSDFLLPSMSSIGTSEIAPVVPPGSSDIMGETILPEVQGCRKTKVSSNIHGDNAVGCPLPPGNGTCSLVVPMLLRWVG